MCITNFIYNLLSSPGPHPPAINCRQGREGGPSNKVMQGGRRGDIAIASLEREKREMVYYIKLRHQMDEQARTRDTRGSFLSDGRLDRDWSESTHTYYFSKFQLFEHTQEISQFYRYSVFLEQVSNELGEEWLQEANYIFHPHFNSQDVFMQLLAIWLHLHPALNTFQQNPFSKSSTPVFSQSYADEFVGRMKELFADRYSNKGELKINSTSVRAVCMGFFLTANETWEEMFRREERIEKKSFSLFQGMSSKIEQSFRPLMVVTEKISNLFGRKKVKKDEPTILSSGGNETMFGECFMEFKKTVDLEKELQRKMSDVCLEEEPSQAVDQKLIVTKNQFRQEESPVEKNMLGSMYSYISKFLKRKHSWQVANSFVTNILDLNQQALEDGTKIRVLRPAEDFYEKLIITWLMVLKTNQVDELNFDNYLRQVKIALSGSWREKYVIPTKYFFGKLTKYWGEIQKESEVAGEKEIMARLIGKIRDSMREDWDRKIKMEERSKK